MERSATKRPVQVIDISDEDEHDGDEIEALQDLPEPHHVDDDDDDTDTEDDVQEPEHHLRELTDRNLWLGTNADEEEELKYGNEEEESDDSRLVNREEETNEEASAIEEKRNVLRRKIERLSKTMPTRSARFALPTPTPTSSPTKFASNKSIILKDNQRRRVLFDVLLETLLLQGFMVKDDTCTYSRGGLVAFFKRAFKRILVQEKEEDMKVTSEGIANYLLDEVLSLSTMLILESKIKDGTISREVIAACSDRLQMDLALDGVYLSVFDPAYDKNGELDQSKLLEGQAIKKYYVGMSAAGGLLSRMISHLNFLYRASSSSIHYRLGFKNDLNPDAPAIDPSHLALVLGTLPADYEQHPLSQLYTRREMTDLVESTLWIQFGIFDNPKFQAQVEAAKVKVEKLLGRPMNKLIVKKVEDQLNVLPPMASTLKKDYDATWVCELEKFLFSSDSMGLRSLTLAISPSILDSTSPRDSLFLNGVKVNYKFELDEFTALSKFQAKYCHPDDSYMVMEREKFLKDRIQEEMPGLGGEHLEKEYRKRMVNEGNELSRLDSARNEALILRDQLRTSFSGDSGGYSTISLTPGPLYDRKYQYWDLTIGNGFRFPIPHLYQNRDPAYSILVNPDRIAPTPIHTPKSATTVTSRANQAGLVRFFTAATYQEFRSDDEDDEYNLPSGFIPLLEHNLSNRTFGLTEEQMNSTDAARLKDTISKDYIVPSSYDIPPIGILLDLPEASSPCWLVFEDWNRVGHKGWLNGNKSTGGIWNDQPEVLSVFVRRFFAWRDAYLEVIRVVQENRNRLKLVFELVKDKRAQVQGVVVDTKEKVPVVVDVDAMDESV